MAKKIKLNNKDNDFTGGNKADYVLGQGGDDNISGGGGNDKLYGGDGNDLLRGGAGDDKLYGDAGDDRLLGGAGDDSIDASEGNDTVDGGEGDDIVTLAGNFADATVAMDGSYYAITIDGVTTKVKNVELFKFADGTVGTEELDAKVSGTTGKTFVLTEAIDNVAGTAGDDVITAGTTGAGNDTLNAGDVIVGGDGTDTINIFGNGNATAFSAASVSGVENVNVQLAASSINVSTNADVEKVTLVNNSSGANTITLLKAQTAVLAGTVGTTATLTYFDASAGTADAASIEVNGATLTTGVTAAAIETLNIAATGVNALGTLTAAAATTLNVTGTGSVTLVTAAPLATIDASANTGGIDLDISGSAAADLSVKGSSANDTLTVNGAWQTAADVIDLGAGTNDALIFTGGFSITTAVQAALISKVSGVEELGTVASVLAVDGDLVSQTRFSTSGAGGGFTVTDAAQGTTLEFGAGVAAASTLAMKLGANTLNIELAGSKTAAADVGNGLDVTGSATINILSSGTAGIANNELDLTVADNQSIVLTGSQNTTLTVANNPSTTGVSIDASAFTGAATITGTDDADSIKGGTGADVLTGGDGADSLTGGAGADTFVFTDATTKDTISDFTVAQADKLRFDISDLALNAADYTAGAGQVVTAAQATALGAGGADNHVIIDTAANILAFTDAGTSWTGPVIAIASDTGNVYYDLDGTFATAGDTVIIGSVTAAQAALIAAGNLDFV